VTGDTLVLPAARMKGRVAHAVPLSTQAAALIGAAPRDGTHVFGRTLLGNFARLKHQLDAHMDGVPHWTVHDIRRSVASGMARIGVAMPVIERLLAHRSGSFRGVVGTYQRHSFLPEMAAGLQRWGDHLDHLVTGKPAKVVRLRSRG
jgi:integrase